MIYNNASIPFQINLLIGGIILFLYRSDPINFIRLTFVLHYVANIAIRKARRFIYSPIRVHSIEFSLHVRNGVTALIRHLFFERSSLSLYFSLQTNVQRDNDFRLSNAISQMGYIIISPFISLCYSDCNEIEALETPGREIAAVLRRGGISGECFSIRS